MKYYKTQLVPTSATENLHLLGPANWNAFRDWQVAYRCPEEGQRDG